MNISWNWLHYDGGFLLENNEREKLLNVNWSFRIQGQSQQLDKSSLQMNASVDCRTRNDFRMRIYDVGRPV